MLSYLQVSKENVRHNLGVLKSQLAEGIKVSVAVKGNAYGHGLAEIVKCLDGQVDYFQVDDLLELREIRCHTQVPTLVLGYVAESEWQEALQLGASFALYSFEQAEIIEKAAAALAVQAKVHIMVDTGLGREGIIPEQFSDLYHLCERLPHIEVEGVYSHFANVEDTEDPTHARLQIERFATIKNQLPKSILTHVSGTGGSLLYEPQEKNDLVRLGLGVYGMWPSQELKAHFASQSLELRPILRWVTHVAQVKHVPEGYSIGYGLSYQTKRPTTLALIPQGYSDGYDRLYSNKAEVLIRGQRCPVLGRVAMNMFVVDVTDIVDELEWEEEVVLLGTQRDETITAEELAEWSDTINYEVTTRISPLLPRL